MAGVKNKSGGWNKRQEYDWRDLISENKTFLLKLAKKYTKHIKDFEDEEIADIVSDPKKFKLMMKAIDVGTAICIKAMPSKIEGEGLAPNILIQWSGEDEEMPLLPDRN